MKLIKPQFSWKLFLIVLIVSILPYVLNQLGFDFSSKPVALKHNANSFETISSDDQFFALAGALHHVLLEWSAVILALIAGFASYLHYYRYRDISVAIIGLALLCAGITDAFHTLAATRIISANVPNADFIPFTWAFSRIFNASIMMLGVSLSLWLTRPSLWGGQQNNKADKNVIYGVKTLVFISVIFVFGAVLSVIVASTSQQLPQTTFSNAFVTRPYDIVPLAFFIFSGVLVWIWYQRKHTALKFALLLSLIPEVATQLHMSFGSIALFDNHFNIAHGLKIVAYLIIVIGLLFSLLKNISLVDDDSVSDKNIKNDQDEDYLSYLPSKELRKDFLEVGVAKYPQVVYISGFTFIIAIVITLLVSGVFYVDTKKLTNDRRLKELAIHGGFIESLVNDIYRRAEGDIIFLSHTPPIQGIVQADKNNDHKDYKLWFDRLSIIFSEIMKGDQNYKNIRYIKNSNSMELVKSYREGDNVYVVPESRLLAVNKLFFFDHDENQDKVSFYDHNLFKKDFNSSESALDLIAPVFNGKTGEYFGALNLQLNLGEGLRKLKLNDLVGQKIYIANQDGDIIYSNDISDEENIKKLQDKFPALNLIIENNIDHIEVRGEGNDEAKGYYQTLHLKLSGIEAVLRLFIRLDERAVQAQLNTFMYRSLLLGFSLSIMSLALAIIVSRRLSASLQKTASEMVRYGRTGEIGELPIDSLDEVGVLARSFHNMLVNKEANDKELLQQKNAMDEHAIVSITDVQGTILYVNKSFINISQYSKEELVGNNHRILNSGHHGLQFFKMMYQTISRGNTWKGDICNKAKNGKLYWVKTTIVPFFSKNGRLESYVSIRTEITENKNNIKNLAVIRDELSGKILKLQEANAELDQFAYVASHDLKSPLNGISQLVTWLEEDCQDILPDESKEHLFLLKSRSKRMINLLNDLLDYSRIGRQEHELETFNLAELVNDVFELQGNRDGFSCEAPDVDIRVQKTPFELVIRNIISNALKHHDKSSGEIVVLMSEVDGFYIIKVQDNGPGIPPALHNKALEMFQTLQSRDKVEGSGMGLALVNKTVVHHGGHLEIESDGGRGTAIVVKWPKIKDDL